MLKSLKNLGKVFLFPLTLTSFVCLGFTRGLLEVGKFTTEFVAQHGLGITKSNGYKSDFEAKTFDSAIDRVNSFSSWYFKKSIKQPYSKLFETTKECLGEAGIKTTSQSFVPKESQKEYNESIFGTGPSSTMVPTSASPLHASDRSAEMAA